MHRLFAEASRSVNFSLYVLIVKSIANSPWGNDVGDEKTIFRTDIDWGGSGVERMGM